MWVEGPIVVVDDDPDDQYFYQKSLEKFVPENELVFFSNGKEALAYLEQPSVQPFVILCDINMPVMSGLDLRRKMCENKNLCLKNTPFIFLSTSAHPEDVRLAFSLFIHGFFKKETSLARHERTLQMIIEYWRSCRYFASSE